MAMLGFTCTVLVTWEVLPMLVFFWSDADIGLRTDRSLSIYTTGLTKYTQFYGQADYSGIWADGIAVRIVVVPRVLHTAISSLLLAVCLCLL